MTIELLQDINIRPQNKKEQLFCSQHEMGKKSKYEVIQMLQIDGSKPRTKIYPYIITVMVKDKRLIPLRKIEFKIINEN